WAPLRDAYDLRVPDSRVRTLDHDLAYRGMKNGDIDVTDVYTTDGEIRYYDLVVLEDDRHFFPSYDAVWVYRAELRNRLLPPLLPRHFEVTGLLSAAGGPLPAL